MAGMRTAHGHTLIELLLVLLVLGILVATGMPRFGRWRDAIAASSARDELAARLAWTRVAAASGDGAMLVLHLPDGRYRIELGDGRTAHTAVLGERFDVVVQVAGVSEPDSVVLRYDALGIGRMTGRSILLQRGAAVAGLTISPHGRYRRW